MSTTQTNRRINPEPGSRVVAANGKELGPVKEVQGPYFKVDVRWGKDYWLSFEEVLNADANTTLLIIPSDEINLYKLAKPRAHDGEHPAASASTDWLDREMLQR